MYIIKYMEIYESLTNTLRNFLDSSFPYIDGIVKIIIYYNYLYIIFESFFIC